MSQDEAEDAEIEEEEEPLEEEPEEEDEDENDKQEGLGRYIPYEDRTPEQIKKTAEAMKIPSNEETEEAARQLEAEESAKAKTVDEAKPQPKGTKLDRRRPTEFAWSLNREAYHFGDPTVFAIWQRIVAYVERTNKMLDDGYEISETTLNDLTERYFKMAAQQLQLQNPKKDKDRKEEEEVEKPKPIPASDTKAIAPRTSDEIVEEQLGPEDSLVVARKAGMVEVPGGPTPVQQYIERQSAITPDDFYKVPVRRQDRDGRWRTYYVNQPLARTWHKFRKGAKISVETIEEEIVRDDKGMPIYMKVRVRATAPDASSVEGEADWSWVLEAQRLIAEKLQLALKAQNEGKHYGYRPDDFALDENGKFTISDPVKRLNALLDLARARMFAYRTIHTKAESRAIGKLLAISSMDGKEMEEFASEYDRLIAEATEEKEEINDTME